MTKRAHLIKAKVGQHTGPGSIAEGRVQVMQWAHMVGATKAQHAHLAYLQPRQRARQQCHSLQRKHAAPILLHRPRVIHSQHHLHIRRTQVSACPHCEHLLAKGTQAWHPRALDAAQSGDLTRVQRQVGNLSNKDPLHRSQGQPADNSASAYEERIGGAPGRCAGRGGCAAARSCLCESGTRCRR